MYIKTIKAVRLHSLLRERERERGGWGDGWRERERESGGRG